MSVVSRSGSALVTALTLAALAPGCAGGDAGEPRVPPRVAVEAIDRDRDGLVIAEGWLLASPGSVPRLCASLAESFPPQCGSPWLEVPGLDVDLVAATSTDAAEPPSRRTVWSDRAVDFIGYLDDGELQLVGSSLRGADPALLVVARVGPVCPVETVPPDPACAARPPESATIDVRRDEELYVSLRTDALGVAVAFVDAGAYEVVPRSLGGPTVTPEPQSVEVGSGATVVRVDYDSGIR